MLTLKNCISRQISLQKTKSGTNNNKDKPMLRITPRILNQKGTRPDFLKTQQCAPVELMKCLFWHALQLAHTKRKHFYRCLAIIPKSIRFEIR